MVRLPSLLSLKAVHSEVVEKLQKMEVFLYQIKKERILFQRVIK